MIDVWTHIQEKPGIAISINRWGPSFWRILNYIVFVSDALSPELMVKVLKLIAQLVPCPSCAAHFSEYINNYNFSEIKTRDEMITWLVTCHNAVNDRTKKPTLTQEHVADVVKTEIMHGINITVYWEFMLLNLALYIPKKRQALIDFCMECGNILGCELLKEFAKIVTDVEDSKEFGENVLSKLVTLSPNETPLTKDFFFRNFLHPGMYSSYGIDAGSSHHKSLSQAMDKKMSSIRESKPHKNDTEETVSQVNIWAWVVVGVIALTIICTIIIKTMKRYRKRRLPVASKLPP